MKERVLVEIKVQLLQSSFLDPEIRNGMGNVKLLSYSYNVPSLRLSAEGFRTGPTKEVKL